MIKPDIEIVLKKVQISKSCHQKNLKILEKIYFKVQHQEFMDVLSQYLQEIFSVQNEFSERTLDFLAQFVTHMTSSENTDDEELFEDKPVHPFLTDIVIETLKYYNMASECLRFNSCLFMRLILHHIGSKIQLENSICDLIQDAMLERTMDPKSSIRHQAVMALVRLQDPLNPDCPVINTFLSLIVDGNPLIRAETVKIIAPYNVTIPHIIKRLQDVDANVRIMALRRCADIGPKSFKIVERHHVLKCGLSEDNKKVKQVFTENLLVKWLNAYNRNVVEFLKVLKLDADENDVITTEEICKDVMNLILSIIPLGDLIGELPVKENNMIPVQDLTSECVIVWNVTIQYMKDFDDKEEYLEQILPELSSLCSYIEGFTTYKKKSIIEEWQYLEYQEMLYNLIEVVERHDFSDEVGRKKIIELLMNLIKDEVLQFRLLKKVITLAISLKPKKDDFITEICHIISEIREPLVEKTSSQTDNPNNDFDIARLRVKLNMLESQLEDATAEKDFLKAHAFEQEILKIEQELEKMSAPVVEVVKVTKDDPKTLCRCLDILIALLQLHSVNTLTPSLVAVKDEFIVPLLDYNNTEVHWRALNCLGLFCIIDKALAEEYVKILSIPIITYRAITNYNKLALMTSVKAISDLFRVHSIQIFGGEANDRTDETANNMNTTKRRLYRNDEDDNSLNDLTRFHFETIIEIMLDMLDDENSDIRECAVTAIAKLIRGNFPVTPPIMTRMILKWYNPLTGKASDSLQQILGGTIGNYANNVKGAKEILSKAVIPIINVIASAPKTSPLADVDIDNLMKFLAVLTSTGKDMEVVNPHLTLAHMICHEILKKKNSAAIPYLTKILLHLDFFTDNVTALTELLQQVEIVLEEVTDLDKTSSKNLRKTMGKLEAAISVENKSAENSENAVNDGNLEINELVDTAAENSATNTVEISQNSCITQANTDDNQRKRKRNEDNNLVIEEDSESQTNERLNCIHLDENGTKSGSETENSWHHSSLTKLKKKKRKLSNTDIGEPQNSLTSQESDDQNIDSSLSTISGQTQRETRSSVQSKSLYIKLKRQRIRKHAQEFLNNQKDNSDSHFQSNSENVNICANIDERTLEGKDSSRYSTRLNNKRLAKNSSLNSISSEELHPLSEPYPVVGEVRQKSGENFSPKQTFRKHRSLCNGNSVSAGRILRKRSKPISQSFSGSEHETYGKFKSKRSRK